MLSLQVGGWCLLEPRSLLLADQTAGTAWFKSPAAGTFFLPQQEPEGFMFFNAIHQLGSCLPISSQIGNCSKPPFLPTPPSQADTCIHKPNIQICSEAAAPLHTHKRRKPLCAVVMRCCGFFVSIASSPSPEQQDAARPSSKNPLTWTVDDVVWFVKDADPHALGPHVELFRKHVCRRLPLPLLGNLSQVCGRSQDTASTCHTHTPSCLRLL